MIFVVFCMYFSIPVIAALRWYILARIMVRVNMSGIGKVQDLEPQISIVEITKQC